MNQHDCALEQLARLRASRRGTPAAPTAPREPGSESGRAGREQEQQPCMISRVTRSRTSAQRARLPDQLAGGETKPEHQVARQARRCSDRGTVELTRLELDRRAPEQHGKQAPNLEHQSESSRSNSRCRERPSRSTAGQRGRAFRHGVARTRRPYIPSRRRAAEGAAESPPRTRRRPHGRSRSARRRAAPAAPCRRGSVRRGVPGTACCAPPTPAVSRTTARGTRAPARDRWRRRCAPGSGTAVRRTAAVVPSRTLSYAPPGQLVGAATLPEPPPADDRPRSAGVTADRPVRAARARPARRLRALRRAASSSRAINEDDVPVDLLLQLKPALAGNVEGPIEVGADPGGRLFVAEQAARHVLRGDRRTTQNAPRPAEPHRRGTRRGPLSVALDPGLGRQGAPGRTTRRREPLAASLRASISSMTRPRPRVARVLVLPRRAHQNCRRDPVRGRRCSTLGLGMAALADRSRTAGPRHTLGSIIASTVRTRRPAGRRDPD